MTLQDCRIAIFASLLNMIRDSGRIDIGDHRSGHLEGKMDLYTIGEAQKSIGESRHLINYLIRDRQIPLRKVGMAKILNAEGMRLLREAVEDFHSKGQQSVWS